MKPKQLLRLLVSLGGKVIRQKGSHARVRLDGAETTVPMHAGEDIAPGTLRVIERQLEPVLGRGWLKRLTKGK